MTLTWTWHCIRDCEAHGEGDDAEQESNRHMRETGRGVATRGRP